MTIDQLSPSAMADKPTITTGLNVNIAVTPPAVRLMGNLRAHMSKTLAILQSVAPHLAVSDGSVVLLRKVAELVGAKGLKPVGKGE